jgi:hypothetical protein
MPLLGSAAVLLSFDVAPEAITQHDDWHTHEHLAERLSIPGFLRGTRWIAVSGQPRYLVLYEVSEIGVLTSAAYLDRLNNPSPWTSKIMAYYRNMSRGLCSVTGSFGLGIGHLAAVLRFRPESGMDAVLRRCLLQDVLPELPSKPGLGSVHLLEGSIAPQMTNEQRVRGADSKIDWALLLSGYDEEVLKELRQDLLGATHLERHGAIDVVEAMYRLDYSLACGEIDA